MTDSVDTPAPTTDGVDTPAPTTDGVDTPAPMSVLPVKETKATKILAAIKAGGATNESLMAVIQVDKLTALYGQLSFLNTRGENMAEVDPSKSEFPMKGENGIYYMGTFEQYCAKKMPSGGPKKEVKPKTVEQITEIATKRRDSASKALAHAKDKAARDAADTILAVRVEACEKNLELAELLLAQVMNGEYKYERATVAG